MTRLAQRIFSFGFALQLALVWGGADVGAGGGQPTREQEARWVALVRQALSDQVKDDTLGGAAVALVVDGRNVSVDAAGLADPLSGRMWAPNTPVDIASCAKQFTAACVVALSLDGRLELDADVREYLPELRLRSPIPVRRLLTHTSGLRDYSELLILARGRAGVDDFTPQQINLLIDMQRSVAFEPGERELYSNTNYVLAARLIERASGETIGAYARARLFEPLAMDATWYNDGTRLLNGLAVGHAKDGSRVEPQPGVLLGAGGVISSVGDLARWLAEFQSHRTLGDRFWTEMTRVGVTNDGERLSTALGLMVGELNELTWVEHAGRSGSTLALTTNWPDVAVSYAVVTNSDRLSPYAVARGFRDEVLTDRRKALAIDISRAAPSVNAHAAGDSVDLEREAPDLADYVGVYAADLPVGADLPPSGGVGVSPVRAGDGVLLMEDPRGLTFRLVPHARDVFLLQHDLVETEILVEFERDASNAVVSCWAWDETRPSERSPSSARAPEQAPELLYRYVGAYACPDLLDAVPIRLEHRVGGGLELVWGVDEQHAQAWVLSDGRVTTYSPLMQCSLVPEFDGEGRVCRLTYEGHRVWGLEFERVE